MLDLILEQIAKLKFYFYQLTTSKLRRHQDNLFLSQCVLADLRQLFNKQNLLIMKDGSFCVYDQKNNEVYVVVFIDNLGFMIEVSKNEHPTNMTEEQYYLLINTLKKYKRGIFFETMDLWFYDIKEKKLLTNISAARKLNKGLMLVK